LAAEPGRAQGRFINLNPLPLADSEQVHVGQIVFAVGNPFGLEESVSQSIISANDRRAMSDSCVKFLQTDTAINPGDSSIELVRDGQTKTVMAKVAEQPPEVVARLPLLLQARTMSADWLVRLVVHRGGPLPRRGRGGRG
jgi:Trypsin-like peptidase domain